MYRMVSRYYEEVLGIPFDKMPQVDLTEIAKFSNVREIFKLCQLVLFITVERENNAMVVQRLQMLTEQSQAVVMHYIEEVIRLLSRSELVRDTQLTSCAISSNVCGVV